MTEWRNTFVKLIENLENLDQMNGESAKFETFILIKKSIKAV